MNLFKSSVLCGMVIVSFMTSCTDVDITMPKGPKGDTWLSAYEFWIRTMDELQALKNGMQVGEVLSLRYCRENGWHTADVTLVDQYTLED